MKTPNTTGIEEIANEYLENYDGDYCGDCSDCNSRKKGLIATLHQQIQKVREEVLPYLKAYKQTLDSDWSLNPVQATSLVYRSPESVLRDQADEIERKRARANELARLIDRYQSELDQDSE